MLVAIAKQQMQDLQKVSSLAGQFRSHHIYYKISYAVRARVSLYNGPSKFRSTCRKQWFNHSAYPSERGVVI